MQGAIDRVMQAYGLMVSLTEADERNARRRVEAHLTGVAGDERALAIEGLRYLRSTSRPMVSGKPASEYHR